jgi:hypothetical protein
VRQQTLLELAIGEREQDDGRPAPSGPARHLADEQRPTPYMGARTNRLAIWPIERIGCRDLPA